MSTRPTPSIPLGHSVLIGEALTGRTQTFLSRVLQGLIAGIGFLLAGTILKQQAVGLGREASAVLGTVLVFMILVLLPQVRPYTDTDETRREDTGALQQTAVRAHDKRGQSTPYFAARSWAYERSFVWLPPQPLKPCRIGRRVSDGVLDISMPQVVLNQSRVGALVGQGKATRVAQHMRVGFDGQACEPAIITD